MEQQEVQKLIDDSIAQWEDNVVHALYRIAGIGIGIIFLLLMFGCCSIMTNSDPAGVKVEVLRPPAPRATATAP
jgi:hypothetical protein